MQALGNADYIAQRVISENAVFALIGQTELLLYGSGIGNNRPGEAVDAALVQKEYRVDPIGFRRMIDGTDARIVAACVEVVRLAEEDLEEDLDPQIYIALTDHIALLAERISKSEKISNPILVQTEILYQKEYRLAERLRKVLEERLDLDIPEGETGFIALHIHGARSGESAKYTVRYAYLANTITNFLETEFAREVDKDTLDYMRFVTHLRFAIERVTTGNPIKNLLLLQIQEEYQLAYSIGVKVAGILEKELNCVFPEDEIAFLALYVERLRDP